MTQLFEIKVNLSENQKKNISDAYKKRETIVIRLTNDSLSGSDTLFVPATVKKVNKGLTGLTRLPLFRDVSVYDLQSLALTSISLRDLPFL